ncbi:hypothetical protein BJ546DRAFT_952038 [Cryomyces antarcticus]
MGRFRPASELFLGDAPRTPATGHVSRNTSAMRAAVVPRAVVKAELNEDSYTPYTPRPPSRRISSRVQFKAEQHPSRSRPSSGSSFKPQQLVKASTAPMVIVRRNSSKAGRRRAKTSSGDSLESVVSRSAVVRRVSSRKRGVQFAGVQRSPSTKSKKSRSSGGSGRSIDLEKLLSQVDVVVRRRRATGESMADLLEAGFFPVKDRMSIRPRGVIGGLRGISLYMTDKELPPTPGVAHSPVEMLAKSPRKHRRPLVRRPDSQRSKRKSPLPSISATQAKAEIASSPLRQELRSISPATLLGTALDSATPPLEVKSEHMTKTIYLRSGSIVTVTLPELTAWQRSLYIQGPIKVSLPLISSRKGSLASLKPFQETVDQVYQHALINPRRASDESVMDDICDYFDSFNFERVAFDFDKFEPVTVFMDAEPFNATKPHLSSFQRVHSLDVLMEGVTPNHLSASPVRAKVAAIESAIASLPDTRLRHSAQRPVTTRTPSDETVTGLASVDEPLTDGVTEKNLVKTKPPSLRSLSSSRTLSSTRSSFDWDIEETDPAASWLSPVSSFGSAPKSPELKRAPSQARPFKKKTKFQKMVKTASVML